MIMKYLGNWNLITHGIKKSSTISVIKISAEKTNENLVIEITDNGPGFAIEKLEQINKELTINDYSMLERKIGILNVNQRIKLMYGNEYGIKIKSAPYFTPSLTVLAKTETASSKSKSP